MSQGQLEHYKTIDPAEAKKLQNTLRQQILLDELSHSPELVAGADISFDLGSDMMYAAIIVLELPDLKPVARSLVSDKTSFPYIPGLLAFREMPVLLKAWNQLQLKPDVLILDGHGLAHPRRMGIATHLGIEIDHPTIGCAKNVLTGDYGELGTQKGEYTNLTADDERVGMVLRSRTNVNPIFISPGHRISFENSYSVMMQALGKFKLPETTRMAHRLANELRKGEVEAGYFEY